MGAVNFLDDEREIQMVLSTFRLFTEPDLAASTNTFQYASRYMLRFVLRMDISVAHFGLSSPHGVL